MQQAIVLADKIKERGYRITTAESCTGGLIASTITGVPGVSKIFDCGFVTYSNEAKICMLGVSGRTLEEFGAVSAEVCREMAEGGLKKSSADIAIAVTGIAGPDGGTKDKPVGLVYIGIATKERTKVTQCHFSGDRKQVRHATLEKALELALFTIDS